jgi:RNA polymerase sigma-70 factor, ECF subfamily
VSADDMRLIAECLGGRTAAYGELVRQYQDRLFNSVYRLVGNAEDAEDVVQEAFVHAFKSLNSFKGDALFFTWLYRIAFNTAISWKRKQRAVLRLQESSGGKDRALEQARRHHADRPGQALERVEEEKRIQQALGQLSPEHRAVLVLKDMDGQKYEAMADILDVPIGTIRSRLHRARLELRQVLEKME